MPARDAAAPVDTIDPAIGREAMEWLVELQSDEVSDDTRRRWGLWLEARVEHRRAWQRIEALNGRLRAVPPALARTVLDAPTSPGRRRALKTLGVVGVLGGSMWALERQVPWQAWAADERTAVGERRAVRLPDGTQVTLNTDSAIDIRFDAGRRAVRLLRGEIMIATGHPPGDMRPFEVDTPNGRLRPLGTRFSVRNLDGATRLAVQEGRVQVWAREAPADPRLVLAGQGTRFTGSAIGTIVPADEDETAWIDSMLVVRDMRLEDFVAEVGRYRPGRVACDSRVAALRVSGTYPLADTDRIFAILEKSLPVAVTYRTRYWVSVAPRRG